MSFLKCVMYKMQIIEKVYRTEEEQMKKSCTTIHWVLSEEQLSYWYSRSIAYSADSWSMS